MATARDVARSAKFEVRAGNGPRARLGCGGGRRSLWSAATQFRRSRRFEAARLGRALRHRRSLSPGKAVTAPSSVTALQRVSAVANAREAPRTAWGRRTADLESASRIIPMPNGIAGYRLPRRAHRFDPEEWVRLWLAAAVRALTSGLRFRGLRIPPCLRLSPEDGCDQMAANASSQLRFAGKCARR